MKKVGTICYATDSGLGIQAKSFIDNGVIQKILIQPHSSYVNHTEWYPNASRNVDELLEDIDTLFFFETAFNWRVIPKAREKGIRTILMAMHECTPFPFPYEPDVLVGGSQLEVEFYKKHGKECIHINAPVTATWKLRKKAEVFIHNAGHLGLGGRNGTKEVLEAMKYVKSPIKLLIRSQVPGFKSDDPRVSITVGNLPYDELWATGDVLVFPEKFAGSSLPMQEAFASGLMVMASNRFPNNTWLPVEPLIPVRGYKKERISVEFESAIIDPQEIAKTIDSWYGKDIEEISLKGKKWGEENSWTALKDKFLAL